MRARILPTPALWNFKCHGRLLSVTHSITLQLPSGLCYLCGGLLQGKAWSCISQGSYAGLTIFSSVCISWYGRQLITIISDLVISKKQISRIGAGSLIGGRQQQLSVWLSVCLSRSVLFLF